MIITLDGPAGSGKSTVARKLAERLGFDYYDTGALYRAVTYHLIKNEIDVGNDDKIMRSLFDFNLSIVSDNQEKKYILNDEDITWKIRTPQVTALVSMVSAKKCVREALIQRQRHAAESTNIVCEGRDMGTVVYPFADFKFFLTAKSSIRAERRFKEFNLKFPDRGQDFSYQRILEDINKRDKNDSKRKISPLKKATDAMKVDTSDLSIEEVVEKIISLIWKRSKSRMKFGYRFWRGLAFLWFKFFYRFKIVGKENLTLGPALITANHVSYLDPMAIGCAIDEAVNFLAKEALFKNYFSRKLFATLNTFPVSANTANTQTFRLAISLLKNNKKVVIFPEGTRSKTDEIGEIMPGIVFLSNFSKSRIVPTFVHGTYDIWPRDRKLPRLFGKLIVIFGRPILYEQFVKFGKKEREEKIGNVLRDELAKLKEDAAKMTRTSTSKTD